MGSDLARRRRRTAYIHVSLYNPLHTQFTLVQTKNSENESQIALSQKDEQNNMYTSKHTKAHVNTQP